MTDYKTLRVPETAWREAKAQKEQHDRTWGKQIVRPDGSVGNLEPYGGEVPDVTFPTADVKEAVREVLHDELPEGVLR